MEGFLSLGSDNNDMKQEVMDGRSLHCYNSNENRGAKVVINISGQRYETFEQTLNIFPDTLLGDKERRKHFYDPVNNEFFFDRNRVCFESILAYYQTSGVLIRPPGIPRKVFISDIRFFDLGEQALLKAGDGLEQRVEKSKRPLPKNNIQRKVWELFEHPDTSGLARGVAIWSVTIIILSIVLFCVETLPQFQEESPETTNSTSVRGEAKKKTENPFFVIETFCISWFTLEYVIRFVFSPNKWRFFISVLNMIDLISIIPYYISLPMEDSSNVSSLAVLRSVRLVRVFRIFKLSRYSRGLQILGHTLKASLRELGLLFFFLCMGVILFSSAVYYAEISNEDENVFLSIPHSFWWAIITMTTVGYGDMTPQTLGGKLVGCFCAITGVLAIALPVPVIVSNFAYYYSRENGRQASANGEDEYEYEDHEDRDEQEQIREMREKGLTLTCLGKKSQMNERKVKQRKKKRKTGLVTFPDAMYNALDSIPKRDHQNSLSNVINNNRRSQHNADNNRNSSLLETIV